MISSDYYKMKSFIGKQIYTITYDNKVEEHTVTTIKDTSYHGSEELEFLTEGNIFLNPYGCYATHEEALCEIPKRIEIKIKYTKAKRDNLNEEIQSLEEELESFQKELANYK